MATHFTILAWKIPWTEEPGGLLSMGLQRVGQDRAAEHKGLATGSKTAVFLACPHTVEERARELSGGLFYNETNPIHAKEHFMQRWAQ